MTTYPDPDCITDLYVARSFVRDIKAKLDAARHLGSAVAVATALENLTDAIAQEQLGEPLPLASTK